MKFYQNRFKRKKGVVLMVTLTTLIFLVVIIQQVVFDSTLEFQNEVSHYHGTRAYYAAKAGLELSLLKLSLYRKALSLSQQTNSPALQPIIQQAQSQAYLIWKPELYWPPVFLENEISEMRQSEIEDMTENSFLKNVSYRVRIESEESKFNINDLASPHFQIREWASTFLNQLLIHLRNQSPWLSYHYSEVHLRELVDQISLHLNPSSSLAQNTRRPLNRRLINLNELLVIENFRPELLELLRPYVTVHSSGGLHLQFAHPLLIQSLGRNLNQNQIIQFLELLDIENNINAIYLNSLETLEQAFQQAGLSTLSSEYMTELSDEEPRLAELVFQFDAPQNFQITATGLSGNVSKSISAIIHDPYFSLQRAYFLMNIYRQKKDYSVPPQEEGDLNINSQAFYFNPSTPFIIEWKDVN